MGPLHHRMSHHGVLLIVLPVVPPYVVLQHIAAHCVVIAAVRGVAVVLPYVVSLQMHCHVLCRCGAAVCHRCGAGGCRVAVVLAGVVSPWCCHMSSHCGRAGGCHVAVVLPCVVSLRSRSRVSCRCGRAGKCRVAACPRPRGPRKLPGLLH